MNKCCFADLFTRCDGPHSQCMQVVASWLTGHVSDLMCRTPRAGARQLQQTTAALRSKMIGRWACKISGIQNHLPLVQVVWQIKKDCQDCRRFGDE